MDRVVAEQLNVGGVPIYLHKYIGYYDQGDLSDLTLPNVIGQGETIAETSIQDVLFLENRDRRYDPHVYELRGHYPMQDNDFDLTQFGLMLSGDTVFIVVHYNEMMERIGRKIMSGDVIELPHLRDDALLMRPDGSQPDPINRFYEVSDAQFGSEGFSPTWRPHLWRLKGVPIKDSPEFRDITGRESTDPAGVGGPGSGPNAGGDDLDLKNFISTRGREMDISDEIVRQARAEVPERNYETRHLYVVPEEEFGNEYPWIFAGDGEPPNGARPLGSGDRFPTGAKEGDYFLRTDYEPQVLYKKVSRKWIRLEVDYRKPWHSANRLLQTFIGTPEQPNVDVTLDSGEKQPMRQNIRKAAKPRANL